MLNSDVYSDVLM